VHEFAGHIACDSASNAEIVVPMIRADRLVGVLDLDSPTFERFDDQDREGLEAFVAVLLKQR
jgi:GAF domain-containing protein